MHKSLYILITILALMMGSCIEDGITTSPSAQPTFSVDTLDIGTVFTDQLTVTSRLTVYNRNSKGINIARIGMDGVNASLFRLNVDGVAGREFADVEIRANDSIFVFVEAMLPENGSDLPQTIDANLNFMVNGVTSTVIIKATGQDVVRWRGQVIESDMTVSAGKPYCISDSLVVAAGATLTIEAGARMLFHDKASLIVRGTLLCDGTSQAPILITGDRTGEVIPDVSFDLMSRQWFGMDFMPGSVGNVMRYTEVSNTVGGVSVYGDATSQTTALLLENCRLRNSGDLVLYAEDASIEAYGCEFAEAAAGLVALIGGNHVFDQCTAANNYLFSAVSGPAWFLADAESENEIRPIVARFTNTITYGYGGDVYPTEFDGRDVVFEHCLFKSEGEDDANFINCIWAEDPLFYTVRSDYLFDYRLKPESPAIGAADTSLSKHQLATDYYGTPRHADLGAYVYVEPE